MSESPNYRIAEGVQWFFLLVPYSDVRNILGFLEIGMMYSVNSSYKDEPL